MDLFSDDVRRNPYPTYELLRNKSPLLRLPPPFDAWMIFDYASVKRAHRSREFQLARSRSALVHF